MYQATLDKEIVIGKDFTYVSNYSTSQGQIDGQGYLSRSSITKLALDNTDGKYGAGSFLFYDIGDTLTSDYLLGFTPVKGADGEYKTPWEATARRGYTMNFKSTNDLDKDKKCGDVEDLEIFDEFDKEYKDIDEGQEQYVSLLTEGVNSFKFTPNYSGKYNIKTSGALKEVNICEINNNGNAVISNIDQFNKVLNMDLIRGVEYSFVAKFKNYRNYGQYEIVMEYVPYKINIDGENLSFDIVWVGDYSLVEFDVKQMAGYNFELSTSGRVKVEAFDNSNNIVFSTNVGDDGNINAELAHFLDSDVYTMKVSNLSEGIISFDVSVVSAKTTDLDKVYSESKEELFYSIIPTSDCKFAINIVAGQPEFAIYSARGTKLVFYVSGNMSSINLLAGDVYYIKMTNKGLTAVSYSFANKYEQLLIGDNNVTTGTNSTDRLMCISSTASDFNINIKSTNATIKVIDSNNNNICLKAGKIYYVYITINSGSSCIINVEVNAKEAGGSQIEQVTDSIGSEGYSVIKYTAPTDGFYNHQISPIFRYEVYSEQLVALNSKLKFAAGQTYYIKVYGAVGQTFTMTFTYDVKHVIVSDFNVVVDGTYRFDVESDGDFIFRAFETTYYIDILGLNSVYICQNMKTSDLNANMKLDSGTYIIVIRGVSGQNWLSIKNKDSISQSSKIHLSTDGSVFNLEPKSSIVLSYTPNVSAIYYLEFDAQLPNKAIRVFYYESNGIILNVDMINLNGSNKLFQLELLENTTYYFSFDNYTESSIMRNSYKLYIPAIINNVIINGDYVFENGELISNNGYEINLIMGYAYNMVVEYKWNPTKPELKFVANSGLTVTSNSIRVDLDASNNNTVKVLGLSIAVSNINIRIKVSMPYSLNTSLNGNELVVKIVFHEDLYNNSYSDIKINVKVDNSDLLIDVNDFIADNGVYKYSFSNHYNLTNASYNVHVTTCITFGSNKVEISKAAGLLETVQITSGNSDSARVYVDLTGRNDFNIILGKNVETCYVLGNKFYNNSSFLVKSSNKEIMILLNGVSWSCSNGLNYDFSSEREKTTIVLENDILISGYANLGILNAKNLILLGRGTLKITGSNGVNGSAGCNGANGTNGIVANNIDISSSNISLNVIAGNGGYTDPWGLGRHGGNGGKGYKGGNGGNTTIHRMENNRHGKGGNGGASYGSIEYIVSSGYSIDYLSKGGVSEASQSWYQGSKGINHGEESCKTYESN